jgi:hypothetical protein
MLTDGERDRPAGAVQLRGYLDSARRGADDENPAVGKLARVAVVRRGERGDTGGHAGLQRRHVGDGAGARGEHDRLGAPGVLVGLDHVPTAGVPHGCHGGVGTHRRRGLLRVLLDELHDVGCGKVAVGVVAEVGVTRQPGHPIGGEQPQRVPPLGAPGVRYLTAFQDDVVDGTVGKAATHGQSAVSGTHHDGGCLQHDGSPASRRVSGQLDGDVGGVGEDVVDRRALL